MPSTTKGLPYPSSSDDPDIPADIQALAEAVDTELDGYAASDLITYNSASPTAPGTGDVWIDDSGTVPVGKVWNGSAWETFSGAASPTVNEGGSSGVTFSTLTNPDGDGKNYRLAVCNAGGSLVVTAPGTVQALLVGGGNNYAVTPAGNAGDVRMGTYLLPAATHTVTVGAAGVPGLPSSIGTVVITSAAGVAANGSNAQGGGGTAGNLNLGLSSSITGSALTYATAQSGAPVANRGDAGTAGNATDGVVIVRWVI